MIISSQKLQGCSKISPVKLGLSNVLPADLRAGFGGGQSQFTTVRVRVGIQSHPARGWFLILIHILHVLCFSNILRLLMISKLRRAMFEREIDSIVLAKRCGIPSSSIRYFVSGRKPSKEAAKLIARALKIPVNKLF